MMTERMVFGPFAGTSAGCSAARRSSSRMTEHGARATTAVCAAMEPE
eukprot:COSAG04_NODE_3304_length_2953_cov_58.831465_3_plen_47_part_00